jgi:crotonobetainyl-CoA:carnitine CoA-transferase CaiB-like acyl-CoA transferase
MPKLLALLPGALSCDRVALTSCSQRKTMGLSMNWSCLGARPYRHAEERLGEGHIMASALDGMTILDLTEGPAGALATMLLCDHGARVIRVVDMHASALRRGGYLVWDRGKECVRLDLSHIEAIRLGSRSPAAAGQATSEDPADVFARLIGSADVLVEDFSPASGRQNLAQDGWLFTLNPRLIHCSITAYGKHGPLKDEPPIDDLVMARAGILSSQPGFRPGPVHVVHPLPSVGAALLAAQGIAAALLAREQTGLGRTVATSLLAGALLYHPKVSGEKLAPHVFQSNPAGSAPFYSLYECADGEWVQLGCVHEGFIQTAADIMGIQEVLDAPQYGRGRLPKTPEADRELRTIIAHAIRTKPYEVWAQIFEEADVPYARVRTTEESLDDPQVRVNAMLVELQDPEVGRTAQMGVPVQLSATPGEVKGPRLPPSDQPAHRPAEGPDVQSPSASQPSQSVPFEPPLKGIRVLEITNLIAGPTAGRLLADLGADVIKMEPLEGDISRPIGRTYFFNLNANKRSLSVNTRTSEGKEVAQRVAATADVLLANLRPHATERMGIGPDTLQQLNPRLIETHVTGFGWDGPYALRPGIDPLAQALMGLSHAQGAPGNPPVFYSQLAPTDFTAGAMGALGTILALFVRKRTGIVQRVDTNLLNGGILLSSEWFTRYQGRPTRSLADMGQYGLNAFHRLYEARDGWLYVVADTLAQRRALCQALDCEDLLREHATAPAGYHAADTPLAHALAKRFAVLPLDDSLTRLQAVGVPCAPVVSGHSELFLDDPHAAANDMVVTYQHPLLGQKRVARHYIRFGHTEVLEGRPTPLLGEHTREVLQEVGFSENAVVELHARGVVKTEEQATGR